MSIETLYELQDEMKKCFRCSLCKMVPLPTIQDSRFPDGCPAAREYHFHGYSGSGKSIMALALVEGRIPIDYDLADIVFSCTTCGLCDVACKFIMDAERHQVNMALRETVVEAGLMPDELKRSLEPLNGTPAAIDNTTLSKIQKAGIPLLPDKNADMLIWPPCPFSGDSDAWDLTIKLARLLMQGGMKVGLPGQGALCCGLPAYWCGDRSKFESAAQSVKDYVDELGAKTVIAVSGSCLGTLRSKIPEYAGALKPSIRHATEVLSELIETGQLKLSRPLHGKVTYHDPCYLGRQSEPPMVWSGEYKVSHGCMTYAEPPKPINRGVNGVYDAPRKILVKLPGIEFVELFRIREYSFCCGGGGGVPESRPELANSAALHRIEEANAVGADILATACSHCRTNLTQAQEGWASPSLPVVDIIDMVYKAAGFSD
jgi:Fe-S oxidoreductase